jgi:DNA modification methylase
MSAYRTFLKSKTTAGVEAGRTITDGDINPLLFPFQRDLVRWAVRKGRCAVFADTGMGKTLIQLEWARLIGENTLIIAPLSVARQTVREALKIGLTVRYARGMADVDPTCKLHITNYEMFDAFDIDRFGAVVLDESSLLKAISGQTRRKLTAACTGIPYRLCCTATPAPNDYTEIGNHAEFLGISTMAVMLATFFVNANKEHTFIIDGKAWRKKGSNKGGQEWRIKHHAEQPFFRWLASWAITLTKPSDLGYDDDGFILPPLNIHTHFVPVEYVSDDQLLFTHLHGIADRADMRRRSVDRRLEGLREIVGNSSDQWIIWCGLDVESEAVTQALGAVEVKGSDSADSKAGAFQDFQDGKFPIMVTKPKIGGFGMNFQNAHQMIFFGLNDSWETWYQCIRREWRYGQTQPVDVHVIMSDLEAEVYHNVMRKDAMATRLRMGLIEQIRSYEKEELQMMDDYKATAYQARTERGSNWTAMLGDSCERLQEIGEDSIDLSVYSPPFADLFTYTDSERDLGNSKGWDEFFRHYAFIIKALLRVTRPGRLTCVHTSDIPAMASRDGYIGVRDFPGHVISAYEAGGWTFVGRAFVQKNPQAQAIRVKSKALLFVQLRKDSASSRPALVDQILLFRKPGENAVPITPVSHGELDNETWIEWAHGIWTGISETDTLQFYGARGADDEKHICPLQLPVIERCIKLYSNPGETVLTPFGGIGSEGYQAVKFGRKAVLIELKPEYFEVLVNNMHKIESAQAVPDLFAWAQARTVSP